MTAFLCVLFGGLALLQALPGIAAYQLARSEATRVFRIIDEADANSIADAANVKAAARRASVATTRGAGTIEFVDVQFSYPARPDRPVCAGLCLDIPAGTTCALVGPSGCGKSTVVQLLLRFYEVSGGAVVVDGVDARTLDVATLRSKMGLVAQEPVLFTGTIFENIAFGRSGATRDECARAARRSWSSTRRRPRLTPSPSASSRRRSTASRPRGRRGRARHARRAHGQGRRVQGARRGAGVVVRRRHERRERRARGAGRRRPRRGRHRRGRRVLESRRRRGAGACGQGDGISRRELALADGARRAALRRLGRRGLGHRRRDATAAGLFDG